MYISKGPQIPLMQIFCSSPKVPLFQVLSSSYAENFVSFPLQSHIFLWLSITKHPPQHAGWVGDRGGDVQWQYKQCIVSSAVTHLLFHFIFTTLQKRKWSIKRFSPKIKIKGHSSHIDQVRLALNPLSLSPN